MAQDPIPYEKHDSRKGYGMDQVELEHVGP
jgi:hypothetical protein